MITLPITQAHWFFTMIITEVMVLSDPNYTLKLGNENYFSLAVGAFVGIVFVIVLIAIKFGSSMQFKKHTSSPKEYQIKPQKQEDLIKVFVK